MRHRRRAALLAAFALVAVACNGDAEGTTTTSGEMTTTEATVTTTAPQADTTTTQAPSTTSTTMPPDVGEAEVCYVSAHHIFVPGGQAQEAVDALGDEAGVFAVPGYVADPTEEGDPGLTEPEEDPWEQVDVITMQDGSPPAMDMVELLNSRDDPIAANPVHLVAMASHWATKPGNDPMRADVPLDTPVSPGEEIYVAVVDTGLVQIDAPYEWALEGVIHDGLFGDDYDLGASHGTFIVSLIRQIAPELGIAFARIEPRDFRTYFQSWPRPPGRGAGPGAMMLTDEYQAYTGIEEIIDNHGMDSQRQLDIRALNLSWGTYLCPGETDAELLALEETLADWYENFPESRVFAAAGNEPVGHGPFYPAAFGDVEGVAASLDGTAANAIVWDHGPVVKVRLPWSSVVAPGCDLVAVTDGPEGPVVAWGGSSFASPVAAAEYAMTGSVPGVVPLGSIPHVPGGAGGRCPP